MADYLTLLDSIAQVVGGTKPDPIQRPRFFSGDQVADGTGLQPGAGYPTFKGCYSVPEDTIPELPMGIVLPGPFEISGGKSRDVYTQGVEMNTDDLRLLILLARQDAETTYQNLLPYRDIVPAAFAAKMTAFSSANVLQVMVRGGKPVTLNWAGVAYDGVEFTLRCIRLIPRTYVA